MRRLMDPLLSPNQPSEADGRAVTAGSGEEIHA
jgi:hypothetical protein